MEKCCLGHSKCYKKNICPKEVRVTSEKYDETIRELNNLINRIRKNKSQRDNERPRIANKTMKAILRFRFDRTYISYLVIFTCFKN